MILRWRAKELTVIVTAVLLLAVLFIYGVGVGRFRYPPYEQLAPVLQKFPEVKRWFTDRSAQFSHDSRRAEENSYEGKLKRVVLVSGTTDSVANLVLEAYQSFEITLDRLIGYTVGHSVVSGATKQVYVHNVEPASVDIFRMSRAKTKVASLETLPQFLQSPLFNNYFGFQWEPSFTLDTAPDTT